MPKPAALFTHRATLWLILAVPALFMGWTFLTRGHVPPHMQTESGEWAMRLFIATLALTPLQRLFRRSRLMFWLVRRRRSFGLASFFYAALHVGFYLWETFLSWGPGAVTWILFNATSTYALAGWVAIALLVPLALTSNGLSQRWLGRHWKTLQRAGYVAVLAVALHWVLQANTWQTWLQLGLLAVLELVRIGLALGWLPRRTHARRAS